MNLIKRLTILALALVALVDASAQESRSSGVRRRDAAADKAKQTTTTGVTDRMQQRLGGDDQSIGEGDVQWMRVIYRELDLNNDKNASLYFPEEPIEGQENLFRIIMHLFADGTLPAYEYLDGREIFTDQYRSKVKDVLDRFYIYHTEAKGSTERNPKFVIDDVDLPSTEVLSYFIIERWTFDTRQNRLRTSIEAICPVLHRTGDFGGDVVKYPMFWVKYSDLRPYLAQQQIFIDDDNNMPTCTYADFFNLGLYEGDIYKTRNLRNRSMMQLYPDPDDLKRAQDSIQNRLASFEDKLWVPDREQIIAAREAAEQAAAEAPSDSLGAVVINPDKSDDVKSVRSTARGNKNKQAKAKEQKPKQQKVKQQKPKSSSSSSSATRSVRRKK